MNETKPHNIVIGQPVTQAKVVLSRDMRHNMTPAECILWGRLKGSGNGSKFRRQQIIDGFIADFYCHAAALVVEVDGSVHDADYDNERDRIFSERGIHVLRFSNEDVTLRIGWVLSCIKKAIEERR